MSGSTTQPQLPRVLISILNWNGWQETLECLKSVRQLDYPNYLVVVVDNGSWNDSVERIKAWAVENLGPGQAVAEYTRSTAIQGGDLPTEITLGQTPSAQRLIIIRNEENRGFAGGHNVAIRYALSRHHPADCVFLLNNDTLVPVDCLTRLVSLQQSANAGIVGPSLAVRNYPGVSTGPFSFDACFFAPFVRDGGLEEAPGPYYRSDFALGAAMLIRRDVLTEIGNSSHEYLRSDLFYTGEEQTFCFAAKQRNYSTVMTKDIILEHLWGGSAGGKGSTLMYYYGQRNPVFMATVMLPFHQRMLFYGLDLTRASGRIVKNLLRGRFREASAAFQGVVDGYLGRGGKWKYHDREVIRLHGF